IGGRSEAGPDPATNAHAVSARPNHAARSARHADPRWKISASVRTRARRDGSPDWQSEIAHGNDGEAPEQIAQARRRNSGPGGLWRPERRHAPRWLGSDLWSDPRRSETAARARLKDRRSPFAPRAAVPV